jgi:hypothetical protein
MTNPTQLIISALETGVDLARGNAEAVHANYKGYYPERHAAADRDVSDMEAALAAARAHLEQPAPSTARELTDKIISLPIPASASDLKSDIAELIQSHKYKGLRSIEVLGVFQFLGAEIVSGSNS